jgi:hypothetical protein
LDLRKARWHHQPPIAIRLALPPDDYLDKNRLFVRETPRAGQSVGR